MLKYGESIIDGEEKDRSCYKNKKKQKKEKNRYIIGIWYYVCCIGKNKNNECRYGNYNMLVANCNYISIYKKGLYITILLISVTQ